MKTLLVVICSLLFLACNQPQKKEQKQGAIEIHADSVEKAASPGDTTIAIHGKDSLLMQLSIEILAAIKEKKFSKLESFIHPDFGIRFSPYAFVDTVNHQYLSATQPANLNKQHTTLTWGIQDGSGEPIKQTISQYFNDFVYDADFINAPKKAVNKMLGTGNSLNNLNTVYPTTDFTEFYFPGFDPKYGGMDWKTLRLVFKTTDNQPWLIAIIHDEWTI